MVIPLMDVRAHRRLIGNEIDEGIRRVVERGDWIMGQEVGELEAALSHWTGVPSVNTMTCANGTDALVLAVQALGLKPGQAVICPAFTFVATAEVVATSGGVPIFADVSATDFNLDTASVFTAYAEAQVHGLEVVGIIAVDLFGQPAAYDEIEAAAKDLGCWLVADAAQSFGGERHGSRVGTMADVTTTSFFPAKPFGCYGDGGAVFTANDEVAEVIRSLRVHGKGSSKYDNVRIGHNSRLDTLQAAILLPKLGLLGDEIAARTKLAEAYGSALDRYLEVPQLPAEVTSAWAQYTVKTERRDELKEFLAGRDIASAVYYEKPLTRQSAFASFKAYSQDTPVSEQLSGQVLSLPMHPYLPADDLDQIVDAVQNFSRRTK